MPGKGEVRQRGEGVAIVLSGEAVTTWKTGGSQWKARSLIKADHCYTGCREGNSGCLHVLSCYAPTYAASREEKKQVL